MRLPGRKKTAPRLAERDLRFYNTFLNRLNRTREQAQVAVESATSALNEYLNLLAPEYDLRPGVAIDSETGEITYPTPTGATAQGEAAAPEAPAATTDEQPHA